MAAPISTASDLNNKKIRAQAFKEYINMNPFRPFMGRTRGDNANPAPVIHVEQDTRKGVGDTIYFPFLEAVDHTTFKTGNQQLEGNEKDLTFRSDSVTVRLVRDGVKVEEHLISDKRTPVDLLGEMRPQLMDMATQQLRDEIIDAAALSTSPNRTRVLFGATDGNYNATLATALANVDVTDDKMSVRIIRTLKRKAKNIASASNGTSTRKIRPMKVMTRNGGMEEMYVLFLDPVAAEHLKQDNEYKQLMDDGRSNLIAQNSFINYNKFLGVVDGVMLYEIEEMERIDSDAGGASSTRVAHNLFCGAQAWGLGVAEPIFFTTDSRDHDLIRAMGYGEVRNVTVLQFSDGSTDIEHGMIHCFTTGEL